MGSPWRWAAAVPLLFGALLTAPGAQAQERPLINIPPPALTVPQICSREDADDFVERGALVKVYLWPTEVGGADAPANIGYITPEAAELRAAITGRLRRFLHEEQENQVEVRPEYRPGRIVPGRIRFKARHVRTGATFDEVLEVWR